MRQPFRYVLSLAVTTVMLSGCATALRVSLNPTPEYEAVADGPSSKQGTPLVLVRRSAAATTLGWQDIGLYLGTGFFVGNTVLGAGKFQDATAAYQWVATAAGLAIAADFLGNLTFGAGRQPATRPRYLVSADLPTRVPLDHVGLDRLTLRVPPVDTAMGQTMVIELVDAEGRKVGHAAWLVPHAATVAAQGRPAARRLPLGPEPLAAKAPAKPAITSAPAVLAPPDQPQSSPAPAKPAHVARPAVARAALPPKLNAQVGLEEPVGDGAVHGGVGGTLVLTVANKGTTPAIGVVARVSFLGDSTGLGVPATVRIGDLDARQTEVVRVPLTADRKLRPGRASLQVIVEDQNRFDAPPARLAFELRAHEPVRLKIDQVGVTTATGESIPRRGEQIDLKVLIKNPGGLPARGVTAELQRRHADLLAAGKERVEVGDIPAGGWKIAHFSLFVRNSYDGPATLPLAVRLRESRAEANQDATITVALGQSAPEVVEFAAATARPAATAAPEAPELIVDVDQPLKRSAKPDRDAVALVIGIERYGTQVPAVSFAQRDAQAVQRYMRDVLGVEEENILTLLNEGATKAGMQVAVERKLKNLITPGKSNVYVFYAGHGAPDPSTKSAYLVPFDGDPNYPVESCYPASRLYESLGTLGAKNVTVMLDACFTGQDGRGKEPQLLVAGTRPLLIQALAPTVPAGVTVFAAAGPSQLSSAYPEKRHGLFTYFLLKALRGEDLPADGLTVRKLHGYIEDQVTRRARRMGREQSPQLIDQRAEDRPLKE